METKPVGKLHVKPVQGKLLLPDFKSKASNFYIKITCGNQKFSTSSQQVQGNIIKWEDAMIFTKTTEETLNIQCFAKNQHQEDYIIGSIVLPIHPAVVKGVYEGTVFLMKMAKVSVHLALCLTFESIKHETIGNGNVISNLPPPEFIHVHAYDIPINFTYTPPSFYPQTQQENMEFN